MNKILTIILVSLLFINIVKASDNQYYNLEFWKKFNDEVLVENLMNIYQNNNDLKAAVIKVNEANRIVKMSFANELPHIGFEGYVGQIFHSSDEVFGNLRIPDYTESHFLLPITMNYEVDIWGKNRLKTKSKQKQFEMIKQDEKTAYIYISSVYAINYYNLVRIDKLIDLQKELIDLQEKIISSYKIKYNYGTSTVSDIEQAEKKMTFLKEDLKKIQDKQENIKNHISVLNSDRAFNDIARNDFDNINAEIKIPENIKFEILEQRPDNVKSKLDLEKIGIDIRVAKKDLLPKFVITGDIGFNMYSLSSSHKFLADIGVVPSWDLFMGGRKIQSLKLQKDKYDVAIQHYEKTILTSIQESNDALYSLKIADNIINIVDARLLSDEKELTRTMIKQEAGTADNLDILLHKQRLIASKIQTVNAQINEIISAINLYQALGGIDFMNGENI